MVHIELGVRGCPFGLRARGDGRIHRKESFFTEGVGKGGIGFNNAGVDTGIDGSLYTSCRCGSCGSCGRSEPQTLVV